MSLIVSATAHLTRSESFSSSARPLVSSGRSTRLLLQRWVGSKQRTLYWSRLPYPPPMTTLDSRRRTGVGGFGTTFDDRSAVCALVAENIKCWNSVGLAWPQVIFSNGGFLKQMGFKKSQGLLALKFYSWRCSTESRAHCIGLSKRKSRQGLRFTARLCGLQPRATEAPLPKIIHVHLGEGSPSWHPGHPGWGSLQTPRGRLQ
mmetsp:Transcript_71308/g.180557  ORF Transcript_71308/g.180557 Transcript_71308/m.180557 type:complete len:203 (+) Transcript_71308:68-676(+)